MIYYAHINLQNNWFPIGSSLNSLPSNLVCSITFLSLSSVAIGATSQGLFRSCMKILISLNLFFFSLKSYIKHTIRVARMCCGVNSSRSNSYTAMDRNWWHNSGCIPPKVTSGTEPHLLKVIPYSTRAFYYPHFTICFGAILFFLPCLIFSNPPCASWSSLPDIWPTPKFLFQSLHLGEPKVRHYTNT